MRVQRMTDTSGSVAPRPGGPAIVYAGLMLATLVLLTVSTLPGVRSQPGIVPFYDDWVQCIGYVLATGAAGWRVTRNAEQRLLWTLVAAALGLRAYGFIHTIVVLDRAPVYPSLADVAWVLSALTLLVALLLAAHPYLQVHSRVLALDALLGGLTAAAVFTVLLYDTLQRLSVPRLPADAVATNLAYPLLDVALLVVVGALLVVTRGRLPLATGALCVGVVVFAVVDSVFLYQAAAGTFRPGTFLTPLSLAGSMLIGVAGWLSSRHERPLRAGGGSLVLPVVLTLVCVAVVGSDAVMPVPAVAILLGSAGILVGIVRGYLTFTVDRRESRVVLAAKNAELEKFQALVEASNDFIAIARTDGTVAYVNPAGRRLVGLAHDADVTRTTIADYLTEEGRRISAEISLPTVIRNGSWQGESTLRDARGGPPIPVTINSFLMPHPGTGAPWLFATIQRDVSERHAAERAARELAEERSVMLTHLVEAQEEERARIAADVHDDSVQALAVVDLQLGLLQSRLAGADPETLGVLAQLRGSVGNATDRLRHLLFDLDSPAQRGDLVSALEEAAAFIFEGTIRWRVLGDREVDLPEARRIVAHRMAKEAMVNIGKHARATTVTIEVRRVDDGVEVTVSDDGIGVVPADLVLRPGHRGLADMRDRATIAGGRVSVEGSKTDGTTLRIWLPASADSA